MNMIEHLMIDLIKWHKCRRYENCLILDDMFSKWPECYPVRHANALSVAKALVKEMIPRWGVPRKLPSDNGAHFVKKVIKTLSDFRIHCAYYPQSADALERVNGMLRSKLTKNYTLCYTLCHPVHSSRLGNTATFVLPPPQSTAITIYRAQSL